MTANTWIGGVFAAALTPLKPDYSVAGDDVPRLLDFLAKRGCHGALLLGTTGEGPSFAPAEREKIVRRALEIRQVYPNFKLLVGTGTPSLEETIAINRAVFDLGVDGVVVLPPYYFRKATESGLFQWFSEMIRRSVPEGALMIYYHIPSATGVQISLDWLARMMEAFPNRRMGIKDSTADPEMAVLLGKRFGKDLLTFSGTDSLFDRALENCAVGCITAMANLRSPDLRLVYEKQTAGEAHAEAIDRLKAAREVMSRFAPYPPLYKALIHRLHGLPEWSVRPPLERLDEETVERVIAEARRALTGFED